MTAEIKPVTVSRRIDAPATSIFAVLADPRRHTEIDGSGMLRGAASDAGISGIGDAFAMSMYFEPLGDYVMLNRVCEFEPGRRISWEPCPGNEAADPDGEFPIGLPVGQRWSFELTPDGPDATIVTESYDCSAAPEEIRRAVGNGDNWIESMTSTLARLDAICRGARGLKTR